MTEECATTMFVIAEPFDRAVKLVRGALATTDLKITGELNLSERIQRRLLIRTSPCVVLFAAPGSARAEHHDAGESPSLLPLHLVISDRGPHTEVHLLKVGRAAGVPGPAARLQNTISRAIESIGMRASIGA